MSKKTKSEIEQEVAALRALKPVGPWKHKTTETIRIQTDVLTGNLDFTADEFNELTEEQQMAAQDVEMWMNGTGGDQPSTGWGGLVE